MPVRSPGLDLKSTPISSSLVCSKQQGLGHRCVQDAGPLTSRSTPVAGSRSSSPLQGLVACAAQPHAQGFLGDSAATHDGCLTPQG